MKCVNPHLALWFKPGLKVDSSVLDKPMFIDSYLLSGKYGGSPVSPLLTDKVLFSQVVLDKIRSLPVELRGRVEPILIPCGRCESCRLTRSGEWVARNLMESRYHETGCFLTLTVKPSMMDKVFPGGSLCHREFQLFMKRLRKKHPVRYLMCGEYGDEYRRPHYHVLLYGYDFPDRIPWSFNEGGDVYFRSEELETLWEFGFSLIGSLSLASIQYVCRYVLKKSLRTDDYAGLMPEYIRMSTNPGIGYKWFEDFGFTDVYNQGLDGSFCNDFVWLGDYKIKPPRYFDKKFGACCETSHYATLKEYRRIGAPSLLDLDVADLVRSERYLKCLCGGRLKKGFTNV